MMYLVGVFIVVFICVCGAIALLAIISEWWSGPKPRIEPPEPGPQREINPYTGEPYCFRASKRSAREDLEESRRRAEYFEDLAARTQARDGWH